MNDKIIGNTGLDRILRPSEAAAFLGISRSTLWARLDPKNPRHDHRLSKPLKLHENPSGKGAVGFKIKALEDYLDECKSKKD